MEACSPASPGRASKRASSRSPRASMVPGGKYAGTRLRCVPSSRRPASGGLAEAIPERYVDRADRHPVDPAVHAGDRGRQRPELEPVATDEDRLEEGDDLLADGRRARPRVAQERDSLESLVRLDREHAERDRPPAADPERESGLCPPLVQDDLTSVIRMAVVDKLDRDPDVPRRLGGPTGRPPPPLGSRSLACHRQKEADVRSKRNKQSARSTSTSRSTRGSRRRRPSATRPDVHRAQPDGGGRRRAVHRVREAPQIRGPAVAV